MRINANLNYPISKQLCFKRKLNNQQNRQIAFQASFDRYLDDEPEPLTGGPLGYPSRWKYEAEMRKIEEAEQRWDVNRRLESRNVDDDDVEDLGADFDFHLLD